MDERQAFIAAPDEDTPRLGRFTRQRNCRLDWPGEPVPPGPGQ